MPIAPGIIGFDPRPFIDLVQQVLGSGTVEESTALPATLTAAYGRHTLYPEKRR